jgi:hypothetical protein
MGEVAHEGGNPIGPRGYLAVPPRLFIAGCEEPFAILAEEPLHSVRGCAKLRVGATQLFVLILEEELRVAAIAHRAGGYP